jgi:Tfp pilus assembly protein PilE
MLVLAVMCILISVSIPSFRRSMEQSRADIAGANLRAVWTAQRLYWLEYRTYTQQLTALESAGLVDPTIVSGTSHYTYSVPSAGADSFTAAATRVGSIRWTGQFTVGEDGVLAGAVQATGEPDIVPGFQ